MFPPFPSRIPMFCVGLKGSEVSQKGQGTRGPQTLRFEASLSGLSWRQYLQKHSPKCLGGNEGAKCIYTILYSIIIYYIYIQVYIYIYSL